jgi:hypothetical protein
MEGKLEEKKTKTVEAKEEPQTVAEYIGDPIDASFIVDPEIPSDPGVYKNIPFSIYRAIDAVNHGTLCEIETSPKQYQHVKEHGIKQTTAMLIGRAVHTMTLEPELFDFEYAIFEGKARRGKAWEKLKCKCRIDILGDALDDLKSTSAKTPQEFAKSAEKFSYHTQMSFYRRGMEANGHKCKDVNILAVQSVELLESFLVNVPAETLEAGDLIIDKWLAKVAECQKEDNWPGLGERPHRFTLSKWAKGRANGFASKEKLSAEMQEQYNKIDWSK